ncbi:probable cAMP-specific 3',5'-cyclic phosphodiesterase 4C at C-terminar half [Coccomyxa sp. Obi]|nr:probable cAMP-specific 3',5'-cyclic phosphodiesterase 4C at C-terminar half [Coccomyxa sp. Obi]
MPSEQTLLRTSSEVGSGMPRRPLDRVRSLSIETLNLRQLTDTPSPLSPRSPRSTTSASFPDAIMPQISLDTTIDLVMRLLDDIDVGAPISPARTAHLRNMLLCTEDLQQPLELEGLLQRHSSGSYTGSNVLSMIVERRGSLASASLSGFWLPRSRASTLASRSQSFGVGHVQPNAFSEAADKFREPHSSADGSRKSGGIDRSRSLGKSRSLSHAPASAASSLALDPPLPPQGMAAPGEESDCAAAALAEEEQRRSLCMSQARLQSGAIRSFIRGGVQPLPPVSESTGVTPTTSAELPPAGTPAGPPHIQAADGASNMATAGSSATSTPHSHSQDSGSCGRESSPQVQGMQSPSEMSEDSRSQLRHCEAQPAALLRTSASDSAHSSALGEQQGHWPAEPLNGRDEQHVLRYLTTQLDRQLAAANEWGFDTIKLGEVTGGRPLSCLAFFLMQQQGLISGLRLDEQRLVNFLLAVEDLYGDHPYHNRPVCPSLDSTISSYATCMHAILHKGNLVDSRFVSRWESLICYIAAVVHDVEHPGVSNDCLIESSHALAIKYNDSILRSDEGRCNFLVHKSNKEQRGFRALLMDMVLATDMKQHFALISRFKTLITHSPAAITPGSSGNHEVEDLRHADSLHGLVQLSSRMQAIKSTKPPTAAIRLPHELSEAQRTLVFQILLKKWLDGLEQEFFAQGDLEKRLGLPITPFMDRSLPGVSTCQADFFKLMAMPLFTAFVVAFPGCEPLLDGMMANFIHWYTMEDVCLIPARPSVSLPCALNQQGSPGQISPGAGFTRLKPATP